MDTQTIAEAAATLGYSQATLRRRIKRGEVPAALVEGVYRIPSTWVAAHTQTDRRRPERESVTLIGQVEALRKQVQWFQGQLDEARRAESELRVLLLHRDQELAELRALPPARPRRWWPWRR